MSRKMKLFGMAAAAFILLILLGSAGLGWYISSNSNDYKAYITEFIQNKTGLKVNLPGDLSVSFFPWLGVETGEITVENAAGFTDTGPYLLSASSLGLELKLMPLLAGNFEVGDVRATDLRLLLVKSPAGVGNWAIQAPAGPNALAGSAQPMGGRQPGEQVSEQAQAANENVSLGQNTAPGQLANQADLSSQIKAGGVLQALANYSIGSVILKNAEIVFIDQQAHQEFKFTGMNLTSSNIALGEDISLDLDTGFTSNAPKIAGNLKLKSVLNLSALEQVEIKNLNAKINSESGFLGEGEIALDAILSKNGPEFKIKQFDLVFLGSKINISGQGNLEQFAFTGPLSIAANPKQVIAMLGHSFATADPAALSSFKLTADLNSKQKNQIQINNIQASLDNTAIRGELGLTFGQTMALSGNLFLDSFNVDSYLASGSAPGVAPGVAPGAESGAESGAEQAGLGNAQSAGASLEQNSTGSATGNATGNTSGNTSGNALGKSAGMDVDLGLLLGKLTVSGMQIQNIKTTVHAKNNVYNLKPLSFSFADSVFNGAVTANFAQPAPQLQLQMNGKGVNIEKAMQALKGKTNISGIADLTLNVQGRGSGWPELSRSLAGSASVSASGVLKDYPLPQINLSAAPGVKPVDKLNAQIRRFSASFNGSGGVFKNSDLVFDTDIASGTGQGSINLGAASLDYQIMIRTSKLNLPLLIFGPFRNLSYTLDAGAMLSDPQNLQQGVNQLMKHRGKDIEKGINKGLQKLFGQ